eukprot:UN04966
MIQSQNSLTQPTGILNQPEQSPFAMITPAVSQVNMSECLDSSDVEEIFKPFKPRKATLPFPVSPSTT